MNIKIKSMEIENFKKIKSLSLNFEPYNNLVTGRNRQGKTTIFDAYLWCIFETTTRKNDTVQMKGSDNQVIHKIDTKVTLTLVIDDSYEVKLARRLYEKIEKAGTPEEKIKGTEMERFYNDVPLTKKEFDAKVATLAPLEAWLICSNIKVFMTLKTEDRRRILASVAGEIDMNEMLKPFPLLVKAFNEKKTLEEFRKQVNATKKKSETELVAIPARIDQQDKLYSQDDFAQIRTDIAAIDVKITDCDRFLTASTDEIVAKANERSIIAELERKLNAARSKWSTEHFKKMGDANKAVMDIQRNLDEVERNAKKDAATNAENITKANNLKKQRDDKKNEWLQLNDKDFSYDAETVCPHCGRPYTAQMLAEHKDGAIEKFNSEKSAGLAKLLTEYETLRDQYTAVMRLVNEYNDIKKPEYDKHIADLKAKLDEARKEQIKCNGEKMENDANITELQKKLNDANTKPEMSEEEKNAEEAKQAKMAEKKDLQGQRDELVRKLAGEEANKRIDAEKAKLEARSKELSQIISDCDMALYQIKEFTKAYTAVIGQRLGRFFKVVTWKFFDINMTNDGIKDICTPLLDGIEFDGLNKEGTINAGIDIVRGLMEAYGINVPLFIDEGESVETIDRPEGVQTIELKFVPGAELQLTTF
ncbi:MAG: AAA family ATPase [Prevotella sp.]|nr:AAA family ATPase [Prevotella sp.]